MASSDPDSDSKVDAESVVASSTEDRLSSPPLAETIRPAISSIAPAPRVPSDFSDGPGAPSESTRPGGTEDLGIENESGSTPHVGLGETLQLVRYTRRADTLLISGITPHGRSLTFEQKEDRQGWYVIAAGRRRRPTKRELGLVVATITQEMEAAMVPEKQSEVRSAYRLAVAADIPGMRLAGLDAYRDLLLDEAAAYTGEQTDRLTVVSVEFQAFKRFAIRHGHRIGAAFVQALGERLLALFKDERKVHVFHKTGKAFRLIIVDRSSAEVQALVDLVARPETKEWLVERVWGENRRTHPDEINFHIGISSAYSTERKMNYIDLAQRLSDDAHRAGKLGQLVDHTSLALAKADYRTTTYRWKISSEDELTELASTMDDGPAEVMAEMSDYLHELVPADLEGMAVAGDVNALVFCAIARDGFWQGTTAMRIAGERILNYFVSGEPPPMGEHLYVGGFDLGDEFYAIVVEGNMLYFARGDINSAGATRVRAGLDRLHQAVGWRRPDGGGVVGRFLSALRPTNDDQDLVDRIRQATKMAYDENYANPHLKVNDAVDIADHLYDLHQEPINNESVVEGAQLSLVLSAEETKPVLVLSRKSGFRLLLSIDGIELPASITDGKSGLQVKLRVKDSVASASIAVVSLSRNEMSDVLREIREENNIGDDEVLDVVGFLRHMADILLQSHVKIPGKIQLALGQEYSVNDFLGVYSIEEIRENNPGLYYEAVHHELLNSASSLGLDKQLKDLIGQTMLMSLRPEFSWKEAPLSESP